MWFYFGIFTAVISLVIHLHRKLKIKSHLEKRNKTLYPGSSSGEAYKISWEEPLRDDGYVTGCLQIFCKTSLQFSARRETSKDKWAKRLGLSYEFETGDSAFDDSIYLASITEEDAELIGKDAEIVDLIDLLIFNPSTKEFPNLRSQSKNELLCDGRTLYLSVSYRKIANDSLQAFKDRFLAPLRQLAKELEQHKSPTTHFWKVPTQRNAAIILAISSTFAILGGLEFFRFVVLSENKLFQPFNLLPATLALSMLGLAALVFSATYFIKKTARRHLVVFEICVSGLFGLIFSIYGWLHDINTEFDKSLPHTQAFKVIEKYTVQHRSRKTRYTTYHVRLDKPIAPVTSSIQVGIYFYINIANGDWLSVTTRQGALKEPWLESVDKCENCADKY